MNIFKKLSVLSLSLFVLLGCGLVPENKEEAGSEDNKTEEKEKEKVAILNKEELLKGDFSSIAGEYENSLGEVIILNHEGLIEGRNEIVEGQVSQSADGLSYFLNKRAEDGFTGYGMAVFDVGSQIGSEEYGILESDTTRIRISHGHDFPMTIEEVYYKK